VTETGAIELPAWHGVRFSAISPDLAGLLIIAATLLVASFTAGAGGPTQSVHIPRASLKYPAMPSKRIPTVHRRTQGALYPIKLGLVASLNRPGSNITGVSFLVDTLTAKHKESAS
jgi:hypothetical protein